MGTYRKLFGSNLRSKEKNAVFASLVSLAFHGIKVENFTKDTYLNGLKHFYGVDFDKSSDLDEQISAARSRISQLHKKERVSIRSRIKAQLEIDPDLASTSVVFDIPSLPRVPEKQKSQKTKAKNRKKLAKGERVIASLMIPITSFPGGAAKPDTASKEAFYKSWEWRTLRMEILKEHGAKCQCCGAGRDDVDMSGNAVRIVVDHIFPLSKRWDLRLVKSNLQILCDECNMGKGAWDRTDWRNV